MKTVEKIKYFIKKFPTIYKLTLKIKKELVIFLRIKDIAIMMIVIHFLPQYIYKFSTRKVLPPQKNRYLLKDQLIPPYYIIKSKSSDIPKMKEINIMAANPRGNFNILKKINIPTFLNAFWDTLKIDENENIIYAPEWHPSYTHVNPNSAEISKNKNLKEYKNPNITYVHNITTALDSIAKKGHNVLSIVHNLEKLNGEIYPTSREMKDKPILQTFDNYEKFLDEKKIKRIYIVEKIYKPMEPPYSDCAPTASFVTVLGALFPYAEKINAYGWDFYLKSSPKTMNLLQLCLNIPNYRLDAKYSLMLYEIALMNFYYGYKYSKLPNINIHGYMGDLEKHERFIKKIEKVFFL